MLSTNSLMDQREALLLEIASMDAMIRGKLTSTTQKRTLKDGTQIEAGPYHRLQRWVDGKNKTQYIPDSEYEDCKRLNEAYRHFEDLCQQLAEVNEQLTLEGSELQLAKKNASKQSGMQK